MHGGFLEASCKTVSDGSHVLILEINYKLRAIRSDCRKYVIAHYKLEINDANGLKHQCGRRFNKESFHIPGTLAPLQAYLTGRISASGDVRKLMLFDKLSKRGHKPGAMFSV